MRDCGLRAAYVRQWTTPTPPEKLEVNGRAFGNSRAANTWFHQTRLTLVGNPVTTALPASEGIQGYTFLDHSNSYYTLDAVLLHRSAVYVVALSAWTAPRKADLAPYLNAQLVALRRDH